MHDAVVIGGSIAGAAVAAELARAGRRVVLLEQHTSPRRKACGEGILPRGVRALRAMGLLDELAPMGAELRTLRFESGRQAAEAAFPGMGLGIRRSVLDVALVEHARRCGVEVRTGVTARGLRLAGRRVQAVVTEDGEVAGRAFVAADGLNSRFRRLAGLERERKGGRYGLSAHAVVPGLDESAVRVVFSSDGELYVTPVGGGVANLALLAPKREMRRFAGEVTPAFMEALERFGLRGVELTDEPAVAGPFPQASRRAWRSNLVLAGDAAGFFDGITGEGMSVALASAPDCAAAVGQLLDEGSYEGFRAYDRRLRAMTRNANLLARVTLTLGPRQRLGGCAVRNMGRRPETFGKLVAISGGEAGLASLRPRDVVALALGV